MNKLFTRVAKLVLGLSLAVGVGVAVGTQKASRVEATSPASITIADLGWGSGSNNAKGEANKVAIDSNVAFYFSGGSDVGKYYTTSPAGARMYYSGSDSITVKATADGVKLTSITFKWALKNNGCLHSSKTTSVTNVAYPSNTAVSLSNVDSVTAYVANTGTATNGQVAIQQITVSYSVTPTKSVSGITVTDVSNKTWRAGDTVSGTDLSVVVSYSNSTSATITDGTGVYFNSTHTQTVSNSLSQGTNTVTVYYTDTYGTASDSVSISALAAVSLSSIAITTAPTKTTYNEGESFVSAGMVVTATFSDSSTENVTSSCTFSPNGSLTVEDDEITVSYSYKGVTKTAAQSITVNPVTEVTFTAGTDKGSTTGNTTPDSMTKSGFSVSGTDAAFATAEYRLYSGSSTTFSVASGKIGKITIVRNGSYALSLLSADVGTWDSSTGVWTGNAQSVTFTASAQFRANSFTVEKASTTPTLTLTETSIDLKTTETGGKSVTATVINVNNPTITWTANNNNVTIETGSIVDGVQTATIKPNSNVTASSSITVAVTGTSLSETVSVSISEPGPGETAGTAYSVADAMDAIDAGEGVTGVYTTGIICQIDSYSSQYNSITYWISDDGTTTTKLEVYGGKGLDNSNFSSVDDLDIGGVVIVYGNLSKYNDTYEYSANNYLVSYVAPPKVNSITLTPSVVEIAPEDAGDIVDLFTNIVINQDIGSNKTVNDIVWSSADADVFYVDGDEYLVAGEHKESTILYASIGGVQLGSATIEVVDPNHPFISYDVPVSWTKLTSLSVGDRVVFVHESSSNELSGVTTTGTTIGEVSVFDTDPSGSYVLTVEAGNGGVGFAFKTVNETYLSWSTGNSLTTLASLTDAASWTIHESHDGSDGDWKFVNVGTTSRILQYNTGSPRFACYGNDGQTVFQIFKKIGGDVSTVDLDSTILDLVHSHMATYKDEHNNDQYGIAICNYNGATLDKNDWDDMGSDFTSSIINTYKLNYARSNASGNDVEKFLSAYDYVVAKYGSTYDFLGRIATGKVTVSGGARVMPSLIGENTNIVAIIVVISMVSVTAIGGYFFLKKRREQN